MHYEGYTGVVYDKTLAPIRFHINVLFLLHATA